MSYNNGSETMSELVGVINGEITVLTLEAEEIVNDKIVHVSGYGPVRSNVDIYLDEELIQTVTTNAAGHYSADVTLTDPVNYNSYTFTAKAAYQGKVKTATQEVQYLESEPEVTGFTMTYGGITYDMLEMQEKTRAITWSAANDYTFTIDMENHENVEEVFVCSTRNNVTKSIEAKWDNDKKTYVAKGVFDPDNSGYVPGTITVEHKTKKSVLWMLTPIWKNMYCLMVGVIRLHKCLQENMTKC